MNLSAPIQASAQPVFSSRSTGSHPVGTIGITRDGRRFRYALVGAADTVVANMIQGPAQIANHLALTPVAAAIGDVVINVGLGATAATLNQYANGWAIISTTPGLGYAYAIKGHAAAALSTSVDILLASDTPVQVALTTSSRVDLQANPYSGVIQTPVTTLTGPGVGASPYIGTAAQYQWIQTNGPAGVLVAGTPGVGLAVVIPGTAAGAVVIDGAASATQVVGSMMTTGVDGKVNAVFLALP